MEVSILHRDGIFVILVWPSACCWLPLEDDKKEPRLFSSYSVSHLHQREYALHSNILVMQAKGGGCAVKSYKI